jgi:asparagine synthase (glutamine-hydrolysing)
MVEWAMSLPPDLNLKRGWNKLMLRVALSSVLPEAIQWRRSKVGFETPQSEWIRGVLQPALVRWASKISDRLRSIVDQDRVSWMAEQLFSSKKLHRMDQRQFLLLRLFFLDRWLGAFEVNV